ncbi:MerR family transcriptional regulator [Streptomyces bathyalis]|uniref:MerR family transcriptional regulator n=1 Tax=Streptomyces bathyalis TaxID=2710756 RepID=A0A7T1TD67_9ACTN|nr:MerR family transcriptional regulator [Streptomyces bathyalis]
MAPVHRLSLETVARRSGLHPELVRRFVALGLLDDVHRDAEGRLWFPASAPLILARIQRLRAGFCLNYASLGLVLELLDRIAELEARLRRSGVRSDDSPWT